MIEWVEELRAGFTEEFGTGPKIVTLATVGAGHGTPRPRARTVVCRELKDDGRLLVATDSRSRKVIEVGLVRFAELCVWLPGLRRQFRIECEASIIWGTRGDPDGLRECVWTEMSESARALLFWPKPGGPREPQASAFPPAVRTGLPPKNFVLISLKPVEVDLLELSGHPHRRRRWQWTDAGWCIDELNP